MRVGQMKRYRVKFHKVVRLSTPRYAYTGASNKGSTAFNAIRLTVVTARHKGQKSFEANAAHVHYKPYIRF